MAVLRLRGYTSCGSDGFTMFTSDESELKNLFKLTGRDEVEGTARGIHQCNLISVSLKVCLNQFEKKDTFLGVVWWGSGHKMMAKILDAISNSRIIFSTRNVANLPHFSTNGTSGDVQRGG